MNKVCLVGRLVKDLELRVTTSGMAVTRYTLAVSQNYVDKDGERKADFINCITWGRQAENLSKYCKKGSLISLEGRIANRSYEAQDGTKKYVTEVISENISFLSSNQRNNDSAFTEAQTEKQPATQTLNEIAKEDDPFKEFANEVMITNEDLPF